MIWWILGTWSVIAAGVIGLLLRFCKVSERLRTDSRVCDLEDRVRRAEGADQEDLAA